MANCEAHTGLDRIGRSVIPVGAVVMGWLRDMRRPGSIATGIVILVAGTLEGFDIAGVPKDNWWRSGLQKDVLFGMIAASSITSFLVVIAFARVLTTLNDKERLTAMAQGAARVAQKKTKLGDADISVNIFRVQGPIGFRRLEPVARAAADPSDTPILWTKDKGVIGYAWANNQRRYADLEEFQNLLPDQATFCSLQPSDRFRFTWKEFEETRKYKAVLAIPIRPQHSTRYPVRGVLAISAHVSQTQAQLEAIRDDPEFVVILNTCRAILGRSRERGA